MGQDLVPGKVLLGKYRIDRKLGEGGMAVVAQATHLQLHERVAIKCLLPEVAGNQEVVQRFLREAQAAVKLKGEHVARVIDVGVLDTGAPYIVMEYLDGADLSQLVGERGPLPHADAVDFLLQACEALAEAHALGIVHRDVKPGNLFVTRRPDGSPLLKVLDFGISKAPMQVDQGLTRTNSAMGTPAYMSPEQMRSSRDVDARTDIWALGVVLHELLAGRRPWPAETFTELCMRIASDPPDPLPGHVPEPLRQIVDCCLQKDRDRRFANCADLAAALAPFAAAPHRAQHVVERIARVLRVAPRAPVHLPATVMASAATPTTLSAGAGQAEPVKRESRRTVAAVVGAVAAVVAIAVLLVVFAGGGGGDGDTAGAATDDEAAAAAGADDDVDEGDDRAVARESDTAADDTTATAVDAGVPVADTRAPIDAAPESASQAAADQELKRRAAAERARERRRAARERARRERMRERRSGSSNGGGDDSDDILGTRN